MGRLEPETCWERTRTNCHKLYQAKFQEDLVTGKNSLLLQGTSMNGIYLPINNLLITDSSIKQDQNQSTNPYEKHWCFPPDPSPLGPVRPPAPLPRATLSPSGEAAGGTGAGGQACVVVPSPPAAPFRFHPSAPAQAAPWLQPLPGRALLSVLLPVLPRFSLCSVPTTLTFRCSHRGATDSPEDGLSHALQWVGWSRPEPAVTG